MEKGLYCFVKYNTFASSYINLNLISLVFGKYLLSIFQKNKVKTIYEKINFHLTRVIYDAQYLGI